MGIIMRAKALMVQGTTSDSGKSTIVMALCRIFSDMGYKVAPFKSQNMSLNSYVSEDGSEIARSQVLQAQAARVKPIATHNPILLKPKGNNSSQIILMGKPYADYNVHEYYSKYIPKLQSYVKDALDELMSTNDIVIIEGAGSPAEINLSDYEIANMFVAKLINCPVIIVGDIDKGGVFASIYGTVELVKEDEKPLIKAYLINKFRGDVTLLTSGLEMLSKKLNIPSLGVIPFIEDLYLPAEDSLNIHESIKGASIKIGVIKLPKISNFTDFEAFLGENSVDLEYCTKSDQLIGKDLILIPGTKNTVSDLLWMKENGFDEIISEEIDKGSIVFGICGGFQMLGKSIIDNGIEGDGVNEYQGMGLLPTITEFKEYTKLTQQIKAKVINFEDLDGEIISGYEIHMGLIENMEGLHPFLEYFEANTIDKKYALGIYNENMNVFGTFLHGIWDNDSFRKGFLQFLGAKRDKTYLKDDSTYMEILETNIDKMAEIVKKNIDLENLLEIMNLQK